MNNGEAMMLRAYQDRAVAGDGPAYIVRDPSGEVRYLSPTAWQARLNSIEEQERPTAGEALTEAATEWPGLDVAKGAVRGAVTGLENITSAVNEAIPFPETAGFHLRSGEVVNDVQGLMTWITEAIKDNTGLDTRIEISEPETIPGMIAEGVAQALPKHYSRCACSEDGWHRTGCRRNHRRLHRRLHDQFRGRGRGAG